MPWLWQVMRPIAVPVVRAGLRVKVVGRRNIPKKGAAIIASNHLSALDHVVLPMATRRTIINISKAEHFAKPVKAWFFREWGIIKLQRGSGDSGAMEAAKKAIRAGHLFCIYPEGTRSRDGKLHKGHTGVARLALELRVPVIPVAMKGTFEAKPKGGKLKLFSPTAAVVGEPLDFQRYWGMQDDKAVCRQVTDEVMRAIQRLSGQEYVDEYQHNPEVPSHAKPEAAAAGKAEGAGAGGSGGTRGGH
ncbi:MAG: lysophospholipid acyltransferase family protein [Thermoplasmatota archaeon]